MYAQPETFSITSSQKKSKLPAVVAVCAGALALVAYASWSSPTLGVAASASVRSMAVPQMAVPKFAQMRSLPAAPCGSSAFVPSESALGRRVSVRAEEISPIQKHANDVLESKKILIAPAIQTANLAMLGPEIDAAMKGGADVVHCDIMDGHFTEKLTFGPMFVKGLRKYGITAPIDVHLMSVHVVDHLISEFAAAGANYITFHPEGTLHVDRSLSLIKDKGLKCGLVINPGTPLSILENVMDKVDIILLMSVNPGFKNQGFQQVTYKKAKAIKEMIKESGRHIRLEVDGRVGTKNIQALTEAGIDMFVVGGGVFNADDYGKAITELRTLAETAVPATA